MFRVYICLTVDHDWRLVVAAVIVCFLASAVAISLPRPGNKWAHADSLAGL